MSKAKRAFDGVGKLEGNGSNWTLWWSRVQRAAGAIGYTKHLTDEAATDKKQEDLDLLNAITALLPDSIYRRYHTLESTRELVTGLKSDYDVTNTVAEAADISLLFTTKCTHPKNLNSHLDRMIKIRDRLTQAKVDVPDDYFVKAIISSVPDSTRTAVNGYIRIWDSIYDAQRTGDDKTDISNKEAANKKTAADIIRYLRSEAVDPTPKTKEDTALFSAPPNRGRNRGGTFHASPRGRGNSNSNFRGRGRGNYPKFSNPPTSHYPSQSPRPFSSSSTPSSITCFRCNGKGHRANVCPTTPTPTNPRNSAHVARSADTSNWRSRDDPENRQIRQNQPTRNDSNTNRSQQSSFAYIEEQAEDAWSAWSANDDLEDEIWNHDHRMEIDISDLETTTIPTYSFVVSHHTATSPREVFDSGCTRHMTANRDRLTEYREIPPQPIVAANSNTFPAIGVGSMLLYFPYYKNPIKLRNVLHCPALRSTLISISRIDDAGYTCIFSNSELRIYGRNQGIVGLVPKINNLYQIDWDSASPDGAYLTSDNTVSLDEAHVLLGHVNHDYVKVLLQDHGVTGLRLDPTRMQKSECEICIKAKATRSPIAKARLSPRAPFFGNLIHIDLWGPAIVRTINHCVYTISILDDATYWIEEILIKSKSDTFAKYKAYTTRLREQDGVTVKVLHSDRGGEFLSDEFNQYLESVGTIRKLTVHDTPEHNGTVERAHRTLFNGVRAILNGARLPHWLWGYALEHVVYIWNRTPHKAIGMKTPFEMRYDKKPDLSSLHPFGSRVFVTSIPRSKLNYRALDGLWVGLDPQSNGHRIYWPERRTLTVERNVTFSRSGIQQIEGEYSDMDWELDKSDPILSDPTPPPPSSTPLSSDSPDAEITPRPAPDPVEIHEPIDPNILTTKRIRKPSQKARDILEGRASASMAQELNQIDDEIFSLTAKLPSAQSTSIAVDPRSPAEARQQADWPKWLDAMHDEVKRLNSRRAWRFVFLPNGKNTIKTKWVYRTKRDAQGNVIGHRARLVAQGFTQIDGVDYFSDDTYASVARLPSVRAILAMAARYGWIIHQLDIKSAYLYGLLDDDEEIYVKPPPSYQLPGLSPGQVLRLNVAIYGLKQAGRRWYLTLVAILKRIGFTRSEFDHAVFYHHLKPSGIVILFVHVDDTTIVAPSLSIMLDVKNRIKQHLEFTDGGEIHWMLGIEVKRDLTNRSIHLSQCAYIDSIIKRFGFEDSKPVSIPFDPSITLPKIDTPMNQTDIIFMRDRPYREALGALMYCSVATRPDITYAVSQLSRFSSNPGRIHWEALCRIFKYLKGTRDLWLSFGHVDDNSVIGYTDADGMSNPDRHAISGYVFLIDGGAVSWSSKRQELVTLSTTEAEYVAITHAAKESLWLQNLLTELFANESFKPFPLYSDNLSAIALAKDDRFHARTKHIDIRFHFIRYIIEDGKIKLIYCPTEDMLADTLTKGLPSVKAKHFASSMGLRKV